MLAASRPVTSTCHPARASRSAIARPTRPVPPRMSARRISAALERAGREARRSMRPRARRAERPGALRREHTQAHAAPAQRGAKQQRRARPVPGGRDHDHLLRPDLAGVAGDRPSVADRRPGLGLGHDGDGVVAPGRSHQCGFAAPACATSPRQDDGIGRLRDVLRPPEPLQADVVDDRVAAPGVTEHRDDAGRVSGHGAVGARRAACRRP